MIKGKKEAEEILLECNFCSTKMEEAAYDSNEYLLSSVYRRDEEGSRRIGMLIFCPTCGNVQVMFSKEKIDLEEEKEKGLLLF